jgi:hypothetical protein
MRCATPDERIVNGRWSLTPEQYTSAEFAAFCAAHGVRPSTGRTGVCWDNAAAESFFAALKNEMYYQQTFADRARARFAVAEYIEVFYNRIRLHSTLGYRTPSEALTDYQTAAAAAWSTTRGTVQNPWHRPDTATTAIRHAAITLDKLAVTIDCPSSTIAVARVSSGSPVTVPAYDDGRQAKAQPTAPAGVLRPQTGQIEDILRSLHITEPGMLLRAAAIDDASRDLLANASASSRKRDSINQPPAAEAKNTRPGSENGSKRRHTRWRRCPATRHTCGLC